MSGPNQLASSETEVSPPALDEHLGEVLRFILHACGDGPSLASLATVGRALRAAVTGDTAAWALVYMVTTSGSGSPQWRR